MVTSEYHLSPNCQRKKPQQLHLNAVYSAFRERLPYRPYCSDDPRRGLHIRGAEQALAYKYIQPDPPCYTAWLKYDIDRPGAVFAAYDADLPPPNLIVENPENHHAHLLYGLGHPVGRSNETSVAMRWAATIDILFTQALDADRNYSGLTCKTPGHDGWVTHVGRGVLYDLEELSQYVDYNDLARLRDRRRRLPNIGLGRNCNLFDELRHWAYRQVSVYKAAGAFGDWLEAVYREGLKCNHFDATEFAGRGPLFRNEVFNTAKSVARWTWDNYTGRMPDAQFSRVQAGRVARRWGQSPREAAKRLRLWEEGATTGRVAELVGRSARQVRRYGAASRAEYLAASRARAERVEELRRQGTKWRDVAIALEMSENAAKAIYKRRKKCRVGHTISESAPRP